MTASSKPFFVVFDTSTQPEYYADVHRVLALPAGSVVSYDYKRYLWTNAAAAALDTLVDYQNNLPVDALLMYGEAHGFDKGQPDPQEMLRWGRDVFVPTRSARIVSASRTVGANGASDVLQFHLQLRGFIDPLTDTIERLVRALEAENALPFGDRATQYSWVALLPAQLRNEAARLESDDQLPWASVVDRLVTARTQFRDDVFWRLTEIREHSSRRSRNPDDATVTLRDRSTNASGDPHRWHRDYALKQGKQYEICVQTHSPQGYAQRLPGDATIALTTHDDDREILKLGANPLQLRPDASLSQRFSILTDDFLRMAYSGIHLETQRANHASSFALGSTCTLTVAISKQRIRWILGVILVFAAVAATGYAGFADKNDLWWRVASAVLAALMGTAGWLLLKGQFKMPAKGTG